MELTERFTAALVFALETHRLQKRKGTDIPYYSHLMAVSATVMEHGTSEDEAIAALLHDAAEDQGGKAMLDEIAGRFGENVAKLVRECSDVIVDNEEKKPDWKERKLAYIESIKTKSPSARLISAADKLHNARSILRDYRGMKDTLWTRFTAKKDCILCYYKALAEAFQGGEPSIAPVAEELDRVVSELRRLAG